MFGAGWKTFLANLLVSAVGVAEVTDFTTMFSDDTAGYVMIGVGLLNKVLRAFTSTPIFQGKAI